MEMCDIIMMGHFKLYDTKYLNIMKAVDGRGCPLFTKVITFIIIMVLPLFTKVTTLIIIMVKASTCMVGSMFARWSLQLH